MAIGGAPIGYNVNAPANTDSAGLGDDEIRSLKTNLQGALDSEHNWPAAGGAAVGYHRYGSARPYLAAAASAVSSDGTDARLIINAGDNTLWGARSATSMELLGHPSLLFVGSASSFSTPPKFGTMVLAGFGTTLTGSGNTRVPFPSTYSGAPLVFVTGTDNSGFIVTATGSGTTGFTGRIRDFAGGDVVNSSFNWLSIGTVSLGVA